MNNKEFELYKETYSKKLANNNEKYDLMIKHYEDSLVRANKYCEDLFKDTMNKSGAERTDTDLTLIKNAMDNRDNLIKKIEECKKVQEKIAEKTKMNDFYERNIMFLQEELKNNPNNEYAKGEISKQRALYTQTLSYSSSLSEQLFRESGLNFDALKADKEKEAKVDKDSVAEDKTKATFTFKKNLDGSDTKEDEWIEKKFSNRDMDQENDKSVSNDGKSENDEEKQENEETESKKPTSVENKPGFVKRNISKILPKTKLQYGLIGAAVGAAGMSAILAPQWLVLVGMVGLASYVVKQIYDGKKGKTK